MKRLNFPLGGLAVDDIVCINLKKRKLRKQHMKREARKKCFPVRFFIAVDNAQLPNLGKFESHLRCIQDAKRNKMRNTLILEDDIKVLSSKLRIPPPPKQWDMLYLGGSIEEVLSDEDTENSKLWKRACNLMCHAYVVNESAYDKLLTTGWKALQEAKIRNDTKLQFDEWCCKELQRSCTVKSYIITPEYVIQRDGYSDVKRKEVLYRQQLTHSALCSAAPQAFALPQTETVTDADRTFMKLKLPELTDDEHLPPVALITCVHNQADLFQLIQWCYYRIDYPRDKLTWIIVDDSAHADKVSPLIDGQDASIKYVSCKMSSDADFLPISRKLNIAMSYVGGHTKYVLHYALECFYQPVNVRARVRLMMAYPQYECFGCTKYGVYDISAQRSWEQTARDADGNATLLFGPTLAYTKSFWAERHFDETQYTMETFYFIRGRWDKVMDIPYNFVLIALTWRGNVINDTSRYGIKGKVSKLEDVATTAEPDQNEKVLGSLSEADNAYTAAIDSPVPGLQLQSEWDLTTQNMITMLGSILAE
jgi:hypothetical protein